MATINKDFKIKNGLIVEGSTATVNNYDILTKSSADTTYIQGLVGGVANSEAVANAIVLRDANANFAANVITADLVGDVTGTVSDISNFDTDDLAEGSNLYFTNQRALDATSSAYDAAGSADTAQTNAQNYADGLASNYDAAGSADTAQTNAQNYADSLASNYDAAGSADTAQTNAQNYADGLAGNYEVANAVSDHNNTTTGVHGVSGYVVGTSDTQTLSNKTFEGTVNLGISNINGAYIQTETDGAGDLTVNAGGDLTLSTTSGDIVLNPDGGVYVGSVTDGNEVATHSYVDNAVSGLSWKQAVNLLAHTSYSLTGDASTTSVDGHSLSTANGYRILLTAQSTDSENGIYDISVSAGAYTFTRSADADTYQELIGAAVYVMEGSQYGSTSWVQGDHYLTDFTSQEWTQFSGQGSVTAGTGITVDGLEVSVDRTTVDTWYDAAGSADTAQTNAQNYADGLAGNYDAAGSADTAQTNAQNYTDSAIGALTTADITEEPAAVNQWFTDQRAIDAVTNGLIGSASAGYQAVSVDFVTGDLVVPATDFTGYATETYVNNSIDDLDTDDIEEGITNQYFTDARAIAAARELLVNKSTLTNIDIQFEGMDRINITAENGVADSDTDDLTEGTSNLYFTESRVTDAISNVAAIAPQAIDITWVRREEATWTDVVTASTVTAHEFATSEGSVKYLVRIFQGGDSQVSEVLVTTDSSNNIAVLEYGTIYTSANPLATITADWDSVNSKYRLRVTTANNSSEILVAATMLAYND